VATFADRGCHVVSVTDLYSRILRFLDRNNNNNTHFSNRQILQNKVLIIINKFPRAKPIQALQKHIDMEINLGQVCRLARKLCIESQLGDNRQRKKL
jgi:hypothetical protein